MQKPTMRAIRQETLGGPEVLRLADAAKAHELGETRHVAGKIVLTMP
jgi:hypothetical protein